MMVREGCNSPTYRPNLRLARTSTQSLKLVDAQTATSGAFRLPAAPMRPMASQQASRLVPELLVNLESGETCFRADSHAMAGNSPLSRFEREIELGAAPDGPAVHPAVARTQRPQNNSVHRVGACNPRIKKRILGMCTKKNPEIEQLLAPRRTFAGGGDEREAQLEIQPSKHP